MHEQFLLAALAEARKGSGHCAPNPAVGAVAVQQNKIIAQAWHQGAGQPHAEQLLLRQFPANTPDVRVYVTLEPCNHWGRTPPCTEMLIQHGIREVIYGYKDPNPVVAKNNTPKMLKKHNINCLFIKTEEITAFYENYQYWTLSGRPWVTAKIAQTLDGKIAGKQGQRVQLSNRDCGILTQQLRAKSDVILTTAQTLINDDPQLTVRQGEQTEARVLALLDRRLSLSETARAIQGAKHSYIFYDRQYTPPSDKENISYIATDLSNHQLDLDQIIAKLGALGFHDVFVEAGGILFSALHQQNLVNRTYIYIVPKTLSPDATPAYAQDFVMNTPKKMAWIAAEDNMILRMDWQKEGACLQA